MRIFILALFLISCSQDDGECMAQRWEARDVLCDAVYEFCGSCEDPYLCEDLEPSHELGDGCYGYDEDDEQCIGSICLELTEDLIHNVQTAKSCYMKMSFLLDQTNACFK